MYKIYAIKGSTETLIYNDITPELTTTKLIDPVLDIKDNSAGSLTFKMPQGNAMYNSITPITTLIKIYRDDSWLWTGRVLIIEKDFWLQKKVTCEGALAFLNDTIAPLKKYSTTPIATYVNNLLTIHNNKVTDDHKIYRGSISGTTNSGTSIGNNTYIVEDDSILSYLIKIAEDWGLHIRLRENSNKLYLDMLSNSQLNMATQHIDFGKNLLDYSDNYDWSNIITVLHPLGSRLDTNTITGDEDYPDRVVINGSPSISGLSRDGEYLINTSAKDLYGRIEETIEWSEVDDANTLLTLSELYLSDYQYNEMKLTVKVIDLHYLTSSTASFNFLDQVQCYSRPHAMDTTFIISEMKIPFDKPEQTTFQFTKSTKGLYGSNKKNAISSGKISEASAEIVSKNNILKIAKENATAIINMATNGYITMVPTEQGDRTSAMIISNNVDVDIATRKWTWNVNGLMHQSRSSSSDSWGSANVAITMDGSIVADYITTGVLTVASSSSNVLFSADMNNNTVVIGGFTVKNTALYTNSRTTLYSTNTGVYVGTDGISTASSGWMLVMTSGELIGRLTSTSTSDFFKMAIVTTGTTTSSSAQFHSRGVLDFFAKKIQVSSDPFGSAPTVYEGYSGTIAFTINSTSHYWYFKHGLLYAKTSNYIG